MRLTTVTRVFVVLAAIVICSSGFAQTQPAPTDTPHNPYTMHGMLVRGQMHIPIPEPFGTTVADMGPTVFQEIAPCKLASTLVADNYPAPWGGSAFFAGERRTIPVKGTLTAGNFVNPCSGTVPAEANALVVRVQAIHAKNAGSVFVSAGTLAPFTGNAALAVHPSSNGEAQLEEAGTMIGDTGTVAVETTTQTDLVVELLGYFQADPILGNPGRFMGPQGEQGPQGLKGDTGIAGEPGAKGEQGVQGVKGDKGDQGIQGEQGIQGVKGDTGATGAQGEIGPTGPQGPQGEIGPIGHQGPQGEIGPIGHQGPQGEIGPIGHMGPQGPLGPTGPQGPAGPAGASVQTLGFSADMGESSSVPCAATLPTGFQSASTICFGKNVFDGSCTATVLPTGCVSVSGSRHKEYQGVVFFTVPPQQ